MSKCRSVEHDYPRPPDRQGILASIRTAGSCQRDCDLHRRRPSRSVKASEPSGYTKFEFLDSHARASRGSATLLFRTHRCSHFLGSTPHRRRAAMPHQHLHSRFQVSVDGASYPTLFDTSDTTGVLLVLMRGTGPAPQLDTTRHYSTLLGADDEASYPTLFDTSDTTGVSLVLMRGTGPAPQLDTTRHCSTLLGARYERCLC
jgi:hypothetical protein